MAESQSDVGYLKPRKGSGAETLSEVFYSTFGGREQTLLLTSLDQRERRSVENGSAGGNEKETEEEKSITHHYEKKHPGHVNTDPDLQSEASTRLHSSFT